MVVTHLECKCCCRNHLNGALGRGFSFFLSSSASVGAADNRRVLTWFFLGSVSRTSCIIEGRGCLRYILRDMFASDGAVLA